MSITTFEQAKEHMGHKIVCVGYGALADYQNIAVECETCNEVLIDFDKEDKNDV